MARISRVVAVGCPHHITQRGNRRQPVFFCEEDYIVYKNLLSEFCQKTETEVLAYCFMTNHVHLILVPKYKDGLRACLGEAHRRYTRHINFREKWRGHLWQERFASFPMDDSHLLEAVRYVELNPVRAGMVKNARDYEWSSAKAHFRKKNDGLVNVAPMLEIIDSWKIYLSGNVSEDTAEKFRLHERTGKPMGDKLFIEKVKTLTGVDFTPKKAGRKKKENRYTVP